MVLRSGTPFHGKVALVTGGGSGIGRATAIRLSDEGALVAVVDVDAPKAKETVGLLRPGGSLPVTADVSSEPDVDRMVSEVEQHLGPIDVLINNAAICRADGMATMSLDDWNAELRVDLTAPFLCCRRVLGSMVERTTGVIINISSVNALSWFKFEAYSAAKAGLISLTRSIAARYGPIGIRANAIAPASIHTDAWDALAAQDPGLLERLAEHYPLRRLGDPADVAAAISFLASDDAAWITGTVLTVDGGLLATQLSMNKDVWHAEP